MATWLPDFEHLLREMLHSAAPGDDSTALFEQLRTTVALQRAQERVRVGYVAELLRSGAFAARGYRRPESALANLLEVDRSEACRLVVAAQPVSPRTTPQGEALEPVLPAAQPSEPATAERPTEDAPTPNPRRQFTAPGHARSTERR
jgi:hypothetical protein